MTPIILVHKDGTEIEAMLPGIGSRPEVVILGKYVEKYFTRGLGNDILHSSGDFVPYYYETDGAVATVKVTEP